MIKRALAVFAVAAALGVASSPAWSQKDIRWGTPPVGTSGHKAMVVLSGVLNKEMPKYRISVLPTPGAIATVKGYATGEFDGYYGSDIAFHELATDTNRFKGFKARMKRQPMQSFWSNTIEVAPGGPCAQQGQDQEVGRSRRQAHLHRAAAVRRARPSRARASPRSA